MSTATSKCMYCNTTAYGSGCPYAPHGIHVHIDQPRKCIYCGQAAYGPGCPWNPNQNNKSHVHGIDYNTMVSENITNTIITDYVIMRLTESIKKTKAYELGLVDEEGVIIKPIETLEERNALTPQDVYLFRVRRLLGDKIDILNEQICLEQTVSCNIDGWEELYENLNEFESKLIVLLKEFRQLYITARQNGLPDNLIEKAILHSLSVE